MALTDGARAHPLFELVGDTPMVEIPIFQNEFPEAVVLAKLESMNPGGSIKDRPVARMSFLTHPPVTPESPMQCLARRWDTRLKS